MSGIFVKTRSGELRKRGFCEVQPKALVALGFFAPVVVLGYKSNTVFPPARFSVWSKVGKFNVTVEETRDEHSSDKMKVVQYTADRVASVENALNAAALQPCLATEPLFALGITYEMTKVGASEHYEVLPHNFAKIMSPFLSQQSSFNFRASCS